MSPEVESLDLFSALAGGVMIGCAAALLLFSLGRVAGVSGILWRAVRLFRDFNQSTGDKFPERWPWGFVAGLIVGPLIAQPLFGLTQPEPLSLPMPYIILAGLLVGSGVKLGSGCTSGHGVCGLARMSRRSWVATGVFMLVGIAVASLLRPFLLTLLG